MDVLLSYKPKTVLDLMNDKVKAKVDQGNVQLQEKVVQTTVVNKSICEKKIVKSIFNVGDKVLYRNHFKNTVRWLPAKVTEVVSAHTYLIDVHSNVRYIVYT